ncbi:hypothetical protein VNO80_34681 [Phaseolus coccineus]|nr:ribosomal protein S14, S11 [Stylosanthes scabra]
MARKSVIQREKKRQKLEQKYHLIRRSSKKEISKVPSLSDKWEIHGKLESLPRNSAPIRLHRRCFSTGRPRANYRDFGLSGHILREMVHACFLPGATRSSWADSGNRTRVFSLAKRNFTIRLYPHFHCT